jgi:putative ABC transport system permease protein
MQTIVQSLRHAWRQLRLAPEFAFLAVITLALGIGANTAMFTVVENVLLRPLPYKDADKLAYIGTAGAETPGAVAWLDYRDINEQARTLGSVAGYSNDVGVVQSRGASISVVTTEATPNLFEVLGVAPLCGRTFVKAEGLANGPQAVLLSEGLWRKVLGGDTGAMGQVVRVNGRERTVIGVMPKSFRFPEAGGEDVENGLWLPMQPTPERLKDRTYRFISILATPARGATLPQVQAELSRIAASIRGSDPTADRKLAFRVVSYLETITGQVRPVFLALVAALGLVLLIACANLANLLTARCLARRHEFAVRAALGSGQGRLIGQMIVEAGLLCVIGCGLGLLCAYWITAAIHRLPPGTIPRAETIEVRWTVVLVLGAIATLTTVLSALLPALFAARTNPQAALQAATRSLGTKSAGARVAGFLVMGEVALSTVLLVATGLLFLTLWSLEHTRLGFDTTNVTTFSAMPADAAGFGNVTASAGRAPVSVATTVYQPLLEGLSHLPGFRQAALITAPPLAGIDLQMSFRVVGSPDDGAQSPQARTAAVSGGYERLMGTPVLRGRGLSEQDTANTAFVATINEALARKYFAGKDAVGQQLDLGGAFTGMLKLYTIVGITADQIDTGTAQAPQPLLLLPYQQIPPSSLFYPVLLKTLVHFVVKTRGNIAVAPAARLLFRGIAPDLALDHFRTMQEVVDQSNFGTRLGLYLIGAFAGLAVLMVATGLYGVLAQVVNLRQREFGVRMALGATRESLVRMVLLRGSAIIALGLAVGMVLAVSAGRLIKSFLYGVKPLDGGTYLFVAIALLTVGTLAGLLPAWRAASAEPMKALRET